MEENEKILLNIFGSILDEQKKQTEIIEKQTKIIEKQKGEISTIRFFISFFFAFYIILPFLVFAFWVFAFIAFFAR